jgi:acetyl-CoA carboxylase alpha subunit
LQKLGCVDGIVPEPEGGAQNDHDEAARLLDAALQKQLADLNGLSPEQLLERRYERLRSLAQFFET